jgi:hypothetical protein
MQSPEDVAAMLRLKACGWGTKRIADELGNWPLNPVDPGSMYGGTDKGYTDYPTYTP